MTILNKLFHRTTNISCQGSFVYKRNKKRNNDANNEASSTKNTIRDGGCTALYSAYTVNTVNLVHTVYKSVVKKLKVSI